MGMELTASNMFQLISLISPFTLGFCLIMNSIVNGDAKGFIYLGGVLIACIINIFVMTLIKSPTSTLAAPSCNLINIPFMNTSMYNSPAFNSMFIAFTSSYIITPMWLSTNGVGKNSDAKINYPLIAMLMVLFMIDAMSKLQNNCTNVSGVAFGGLLGGILGFLWYSLLKISGAGNLVYSTSYYSNKESCGRTSQEFICVDE